MAIKPQNDFAALAVFRFKVLGKVAHGFAQKLARVTKTLAEVRRILNISAARSLHKAPQEAGLRP